MAKKRVVSGHKEREQGTYRALPQIDDDVAQFVLHDASGPVQQFSKVMKNTGQALKRVDEEIGGLSEANVNLAAIVRGTVEGTYGVFADMLRSEEAKSFLRIVAHVNAFVVMRALDIQWRKMQPK